MKDGWPDPDRPDRSSTATRGVRPPSPADRPQYEPICQACGHYVGPVMPVCDIVEARMEAESGRRGCCHAQVVAATAQAQQRAGGCPRKKF